jgi:cytochrome c oxidase subunit 2
LAAGASTLALGLPLGACQFQDYQTTFSGAATEVRQFNSLFVIFLIVCALMYLLVIGFLIGGIIRHRRVSAANVTDERRHEANMLMHRALIGWTTLIGIGLVALAVASFLSDRSMAEAAAREKLSVTVTANQWWWDIRYKSADELHLPVGIPVRIRLESRDVIHSFWVPSLAGKQDLIPGRSNDISITPQKIGVYRGQCAEFCGTQHAHMALIVSVDRSADFRRWWQRQLQPAQLPAGQLSMAGYHYVTQRQCGRCHTIAGTSAQGSVGPDLTHVASRRGIAAGTLPMSEGNLYGWIANPQAIKPGNSMPVSRLEPRELHAVVAYLETLK